LEILATPGHTPDALFLLDRSHGLLFTGDTYYPGTIWLYRPETDLDAYGASIRRLAALAPQVRTVLGAHNVPTAPASTLGQLAAAFEAVRTGKVAGSAAGAGKVVYRVGEISFLMAAR
jgi:glyoxylase-like metal-dependent hydrolase (beta-lactamase superfamily II)